MDRVMHVLKFAAVVVGCWSALSVVAGWAIGQILRKGGCLAELEDTAPASKWDCYPVNGVKLAPAVQPSAAVD